MATYVAILAGLGLHNGDEDKLLDLPLEKGLQYRHAALLLSGAETVETTESIFEGLSEAIEKLVEE